MGKTYDTITPKLAEWLQAQRLFFVATAPLSAGGLINCSPKGMDTFRILSPSEVAYLDLTGSGIETVAYLRENGRIVFMFCAFSGPPKIVRLHGIGTVVERGNAEFQSLVPLFPLLPGARAIIKAQLRRISDSCGYAVPQYNYTGERDMLVRWTESKGPEEIARYQQEKNTHSLDGLPGLKR